MGRIYTRTGDEGTTGIHGGGRVAKDDIRIEAGGDLDELNCQIGVARTLLDAADADTDAALHEIQANLMILMSHVSSPSDIRADNPNIIPEDLVGRAEHLMDSITEETGLSRHFILPGGTPASAALHLARAVCRRAERHLWTLHRTDPLPQELLKYINRLSDLLFLLSRRELFRANLTEERWQAFSYKNRR